MINQINIFYYTIIILHNINITQLININNFCILYSNFNKFIYLFISIKFFILYFIVFINVLISCYF